MTMEFFVDLLEAIGFVLIVLMLLMAFGHPDD